jgi:hypothetical protein
MKFLAPLVFLLGRSTAMPSPTQQQVEQAQFFDCLLIMASADADGDNRISAAEAVAFVDGMSQSLYGGSVSVNGALPENMSGLYNTLVDLSEPLAGQEDQIDVYGCKLEDVSNILLWGFASRTMVPA